MHCRSPPSPLPTASQEIDIACYQATLGDEMLPDERHVQKLLQACASSARRQKVRATAPLALDQRPSLTPLPSALVSQASKKYFYPLSFPLQLHHIIEKLGARMTCGGGWRVTLKALMVLHRLARDDSSSFMREMLYYQVR
jgi:hypothetical protein